jgi:hypothetical protein
MLRNLVVGCKRVLVNVVVFPILEVLFRVQDSLRAGPMRDMGLMLAAEKSIYLARQHRALISIMEHVEKHMPHVESVRDRMELLKRAFGTSDVLGYRLSYEFGVFKAKSLNHVAQWEDGEFKAFQEFLAKTKLSCEFIGYNRNGEQAAVILR